MSLYNNISDSLTGASGLFSGLQAGAKAGLDAAGNAVVAQFGGGKIANAVVNAGKNLASSSAAKLVNKHIPPALRAKIDTGAKVLGYAMAGNWEEAGMEALEGGVFDGLLGTLSGTAKQQAIRGAKTPLMGGGSLANMQELMEKVINGGHVRQNLFLIEVSSMSEGDVSGLFNLFAVDVSYDAFNIAGEKQRVGGALVDAVTGQEAVELRMTTYDNEAGDLKKFWARHHGRVSARDGTVGVPADYAINIKILHGVIEGGGGHAGAYFDEGLFRVQTLPVELSRRENGLQELQLTFSQLDTFMKV